MSFERGGSRLLIVSNRLPVTVKITEGQIDVQRSSGGLATGMAGPHEELDALWIGWPGLTGDDDEQRSLIAEHLEAVQTSPVWIDPELFTAYYDGFSNGVLWPLCHYLTDLVDRQAWLHWDAYVAVNELFADAVFEHYRPGDAIWVHDYQLSLLPAMIRRRAPGARIGFFLHIPFPSVEVFRVLPWRQEVLEGLLGADLVGFHTDSYCRHFLNAAARFSPDSDSVHAAVFPMGVDAKAFDTLARSPEVAAEIKQLLKGDKRLMILGVDRLDYTKGLRRRLLAFEELLERHEELRDRVYMLQIVVPSRETVASYDEYKRDLEEQVGAINGRYSTLQNVVVRYLFQSVTQEQLVALYRAATVMCVTPLRDGMRLVAKEFIASRVDNDGVLLLSEFAGAAEELVEAVLVNPYDIDGVARALREALTMSDNERRERMTSLRERVFSFDAYRWADTFVQALVPQ